MRRRFACGIRSEVRWVELWSKSKRGPKDCFLYFIDPARETDTCILSSSAIGLKTSIYRVIGWIQAGGGSQNAFDILFRLVPPKFRQTVVALALRWNHDQPPDISTFVCAKAFTIELGKLAMLSAIE